MGTLENKPGKLIDRLNLAGEIADLGETCNYLFEQQLSKMTIPGVATALIMWRGLSKENKLKVWRPVVSEILVESVNLVEKSQQEISTLTHTVIVPPPSGSTED